MIKKWKAYIAAVIILVLLAAALVASQIDFGSKKRPHVYQITMIYRGNSQDESQQALKQGADQAGNELHAEITYIPMEKQQDAKEQIELIKKESAQGADAIVIEPLADEKVTEAMKAAAKQIPVIMMNSGTDSPDSGMATVHGDNNKLGSKLAEEMKADNPQKGKVILLKTGFAYADQQAKYRGVVSVLKQSEIPYEEVVISGDDKEKESLIAKCFDTSDAVQAVAFDSHLTELTGKVLKEQPKYKNWKGYGFGKTNQMITYLEDGYLQGLGVFNEYSIGYLSVQNAVGMIRGETAENKKIAYAIINKGNIYTAENQKLLFPFVQ